MQARSSVAQASVQEGAGVRERVARGRCGTSDATPRRRLLDDPTVTAADLSAPAIRALVQRLTRAYPERAAEFRQVRERLVPLVEAVRYMRLGPSVVVDIPRLLDILRTRAVPLGSSSPDGLQLVDLERVPDVRLITDGPAWLHLFGQAVSVAIVFPRTALEPGRVLHVTDAHRFVVHVGGATRVFWNTNDGRDLLRRHLREAERFRWGE